MEYVLTWNVRHLADANKLEHLRIICRRVGYLPPQMVTPDILWDYEESPRLNRAYAGQPP